MGSGFVGLHVKGALSRESFAGSRHLPALGGGQASGSARAPMSDHQNYRIGRCGWNGWSVAKPPIRVLIRRLSA